MSKDIIIQKNGVPTNVTAEVIRTDAIDGGSVDWVPEDEVQLLEDKEITANGEYVAADEGYYGYKAVSVVGRNKSDIKLISKTIEANGTYRAESDGAYGYSRLSVRVKGGATYTDPDTGQKVTPDPSPDNGSTIVGLNSNGNEEAVKIIDGQKKKLELASYIQADTLPTKLEYKDGDRIFLSGLVAHGYKKDGTPYKGTLAESVLPLHQDDEEDPQYTDDFLPGGTVFNMPLYADISKTSRSSEKTSELDTGTFSKPIPYQEGYSYGTDRQPRSVVSNEGVCYVTSYTYSRSDETYPYGVAQVVASSQYFKEKTGNNTFSAYTYTYNGKTVYYRTFRSNYKKEIPVIELKDLGIISIAQENNFKFNTTAWTMIYGEDTSIGGTQTITLTWPREGDRKHLQTTYEITVTEN